MQFLGGSVGLMPRTPRSLPDPHSPRVVRELAEPGSCGQPSPRPVADGEASSGVWPARPPFPRTQTSHLPVNISPACPEGFPEPSARRLTTHLSMRQPTFLEPPVCSSLDGQSGHMGSQLRSSRLEPACRWAWGATLCLGPSAECQCCIPYLRTRGPQEQEGGSPALL